MISLENKVQFICTKRVERRKDIWEYLVRKVAQKTILFDLRLEKYIVFG